MEQDWTVLIVESETPSRTDLVRHFAELKKQILTADQFDEASAVIRNQVPLVFVCNVEHPGLQGRALYLVDQLMALSPAHPVVILTTEDTSINLMGCFERGVDSVLFRPYEAAEVAKIAKISMLIRDGKASQRRFPRSELSLPARVVSQELHFPAHMRLPITGACRNLSEGGMFFDTTERFVLGIGDRAEVELFRADGTLLRVPCRVVWMSLAYGGAGASIGLEFNLEQLPKGELEHLLREGKQH